MPRSLRSASPVLPREAARREARQQIDQARNAPLLVLHVDQIDRNPRNPRQTFSESEINALAESLRVDGQLQPVVVRTSGDRYQLIAGERRWRAAVCAGIPTIEAKLRDADDREAFRLSLVENFHRVGLSVSETVAALDDLSEMVGEIGLRPAARLLNTAPSWLSERLQVRADPVVFPALESGRLSLGQASELRRAPAHARRTLLDRFLREKPNTEALRGWVKDVKDAERHSRDSTVAAINTSLRGAAAEEQSYGGLVQPLRAFGAPRTVTGRAALEELLGLVQELLAQPAESYAKRRKQLRVLST
jgi:ParB/RepB/Spo0J family partition protein